MWDAAFTAPFGRSWCLVGTRRLQARPEDPGAEFLEPAERHFGGLRIDLSDGVGLVDGDVTRG